MTEPSEETPTREQDEASLREQAEAAVAAAYLRAAVPLLRRSKARWAIVGWTAGAAVSAGMLALIVWAAIRVISHFT